MLDRHGRAGGAVEGESRFHAFNTVRTYGLHHEFQALWQRLMPAPEAESAASFMVLDAALATMLRPMCDQGKFTTADHDCLLAAWRACVEGCPRSRLFLRLVSCGRPVEALWRVVDGVLAPAQ